MCRDVREGIVLYVGRLSVGSGKTDLGGGGAGRSIGSSSRREDLEWGTARWQHMIPKAFDFDV